VAADFSRAQMAMKSSDLTPFMAAMGGGTADPMQMLVAAVEAAANGILITDRTGRILWTNPAFTKMTGYSKEESVGKNPRFLKSSGRQNAEFYRQMWHTITAGIVWHGTVCNRRKDGSEYTEEMTISPVRDDTGWISNFIAIKQDVSEKLQFEERNARLVAVLEATPDFVGIADTNFRPLFVNRAGRQMVGYGEAEDLCHTHMDNYHPEWAQRIIINEGIPSALRTGTWLGETALLTRDGREISVSQVIVAHKTAGGDLQFVSTIMRDLTERKKLEEQFRQAQKMEAVGQLAGGVAHDFNNLLTIISGYSEILLSRMASNDPKRESVKAISEAGERAASLTRQLLAFSRKTVLEPKLLDLNEVVRETEKILRRLIGEDILLTAVLDPTISRVTVDPGQLGQVLINLAVNARDAMPKGGKLTVETHNVELDQEYARSHPEVQPGQYVKLTMTDTGNGMTAEVKARVFEPFFTTKGVGKGTGLGLAVVHGIIKQNGGHVEVYSEPDIGTSFKVYFPAVKEKVSAPKVIEAETGGNGTETVLLVEDEDGVRGLAVLVLQTYGYKVMAASNGKEAMRLVENYQGGFDLLVTDVVMPGMDGPDLAEALQTRFPQMKVLFSSGYTDDAVVRHGLLQEKVGFIQKPYAPLALVRKVRQVLEGK
jgi:two-component system cell cycle sensor histidine kinase/response regulator CckA